MVLGMWRLSLFSTPAMDIIGPTTGVWNERAEWRAKRGERSRFEARHRLRARWLDAQIGTQVINFTFPDKDHETFFDSLTRASVLRW